MNLLVNPYSSQVLPTEGTTELLSLSESGNFEVHLPANLKDHQNELEILLCKVFTGRPKSEGNLALARQMSINWCISKCKQNGLSVEKILEQLS